ncbi:hypothetical protein JW979_11330 [bacterium]|nr:hypothetical protein [candidate division CSSED10-310 bacterium]
MKKNYMMIFISIMILFAVTTVAAKDWGVTLGGAYWKPDWDRGSTEGTTDGLLGPTASLRYKNVILSVQYYSGEFDIEDTFTADRTDLDLAVSYRLFNYYFATVGYKSVEFDWEAGYALDASITGYAVGFGGSYTSPSGFLFYGAGSYLPQMDYEWNFGGIKETYDTTGYTFEAGTGYVFRPAHMMLKLGYRYQKFNVDDEEGLTLDENNSGLKGEISFFF